MCVCAGVGLWRPTQKYGLRCSLPRRKACYEIRYESIPVTLYKSILSLSLSLFIYLYVCLYLCV